MAQVASPAFLCTPPQPLAPTPTFGGSSLNQGVYVSPQNPFSLSPEMDGPDGIRQGISLWSNASAALQAATHGP